MDIYGPCIPDCFIVYWIPCWLMTIDNSLLAKMVRYRGVDDRNLQPLTDLSKPNDLNRSASLFGNATINRLTAELLAYLNVCAHKEFTITGYNGRDQGNAAINRLTTESLAYMNVSAHKECAITGYNGRDKGNATINRLEAELLAYFNVCAHKELRLPISQANFSLPLLMGGVLNHLNLKNGPCEDRAPHRQWC
ncbi:hypothetical protein J6590_009671 [Homalodisca vitripennis]|nr:hypothetical protein J6590_009671 [Homalodisca vitripennis]